MTHFSRFLALLAAVLVSTVEAENKVSECDAVCRLSTLGNTPPGGSLDSWWEELDYTPSSVCEGCEKYPWPHEQGYGNFVYRHMHEQGLPMRKVAANTNMKDLPCARGQLMHGSREQTCLMGQYVYAILCFFFWMAEERQVGKSEEEKVALTNSGLLSLETAMDLAMLVREATCAPGWAFPVAEVLHNYERILAAVWHRHEPVPEFWVPYRGALVCNRTRELEAHEISKPLPRSSGGSGAEGGSLHSYAVACLVLVRYPEERSRMDAVCDTYGSSCSPLIFISASLDPDLPSWYRGFKLLNVRALSKHMLPDPSEEKPGPANTIMKTLNTLALAGAFVQRAQQLGQPPSDVFCRLDADTAFFPENLQRVLACRQFDPELPWAIGHENYVHKHQQPGYVFLNGGTGVCLSRGAVLRFHSRERAGEVKYSGSVGAWNSGSCVASEGHWDDVVAGSCLAQFRIPVSRWGEDCWGRSLFWPGKLESAFPGGAPWIRPPLSPPPVSYFLAPVDAKQLPTNFSEERFDRMSNYGFWRYRVWQHLACSNDCWLSRFPIALHPYKDPTKLRAVWESIRSGSFSREGQFFQIWDGSSLQCEGLVDC